MAISESEIEKGIYSAFYNLLNNNITNPHSGAHWIFSEEPDKSLSSNEDYPIIIISPADIGDWEDFTMDKIVTRPSVDIRVQATNWADADDYMSQISNIIRTKGRYMRQTHNISRIRPAGSDSGSFLRGKIKVHERIITLNMEFIFSMTKGY